MNKPQTAEPKAPAIHTEAAESAPEPTSGPSPYEAACLDVARREQAMREHVAALTVERQTELSLSAKAGEHGDPAAGSRHHKRAFEIDAEIRRVNFELTKFPGERLLLVSGQHHDLVLGTVQSALGQRTPWATLAEAENRLAALVTDDMREAAQIVVENARVAMVRPSAIAQALADASTATTTTSAGLMKAAQSLLAR